MRYYTKEMKQVITGIGRGVSKWKWKNNSGLIADWSADKEMYWYDWCEQNVTEDKIILTKKILSQEAKLEILPSGEQYQMTKHSWSQNINLRKYNLVCEESCKKDWWVSVIG